MHSNPTRLVESHKQHSLQQEAEGQVASAPPPHSRLQHQLRAAERPAMSGSGQRRQGSEVRLMHQQQPHGAECPVAGRRTGGRAGRRLTRTGERCTLIRAARLPGDETGTLRSSTKHQTRDTQRDTNPSTSARRLTSPRPSGPSRGCRWWPGRPGKSRPRSCAAGRSGWRGTGTFHAGIGRPTAGRRALPD